MHSYNELLEKYNRLLQEYERLKSENMRLKQQLGLPIVENEKTEIVSGINKYSSPEAKIKLFRSLFKGREDVFARRWYSQSLKRGGYQPVCENEWVDGVCDKKKYKCSECPNRKLAQLTDKDIYRHLAGKDYYCRDVIGIYPMLKDETCLFLAFDFDDENFKEDVLAVQRTCKNHGFSSYIEISRSGNGAHLWMFFEEAISALDARKLGSILLTETMKECMHLSFASYDRMFPNQDTMPKGGFGNLIALPLQGQARKNGGSVFVDKYFAEYDDCWAFLDTIKKIPPEQVEVFLAARKNEMGELMSASDVEPWKTKENPSITAMDCADELIIVQANMLFIPKKALSPNLHNSMKRLAAFKNPDFYKAQAMRLSIYNKPRVISTAEMTDDYLALPRGCKQALCELLDDAGIEYQIVDKTNKGEIIPVSFCGQLREEQNSAAKALLGNEIGVLSATTAFGKTVIAAYMIGKKKTNTLVLVHTQALMKQWQKALKDFLRIDIIEPEQKGRGRKRKWSPIGTIGGGSSHPGGIVDIALMQSLIDGDDVKAIVRDYGMIIVDECHHISAVNFERVLKYANSKYVYGLTATPTRQDGHHPIIFMQCGPIRYRVDAKTQAEKRSFEHYIIPRFTRFRDLSIDNINIAAAYQKLAESEHRNRLILDDVKTALASDRIPLVLTERREHVIYLSEKIKEFCDNVVELYGTPSLKERREQMERLMAISSNEPLVIVATGKYIGEGFDYPRLDTLFLALPIAWKGKVAQYAGRLHREYPGKSEVYIYDYIDIHVPVFERMYQKRLSGYASIGYKVKSAPMIMENSDIIYSGADYYAKYIDDIRGAQKEIVLAASYIRSSKFASFIQILSEKLINGVSVVIITKSLSSYSESKQKSLKELYSSIENYGIKLIQKEKTTENLTLIDQNTAWYGSINYMAFSSQAQNAIRIENTDIAGLLLDAVMKED
ncbi:MAG: DEAD/DEAH box helicase family protein [Clostridia bacterium]|nr:DEAD/DEAH box helicase family protein [Clostridia bacterium]